MLNITNAPKSSFLFSIISFVTSIVDQFSTSCKSAISRPPPASTFVSPAPGPSAPVVTELTDSRAEQQSLVLAARRHNYKITLSPQTHRAES